ncbi:MAG: hypothetical protein F4Y14_11755, partial [Acidobacteria bacterium]|nr:hypothetical protein [Acidobacteriota bacterium]
MRYTAPPSAVEGAAAPVLGADGAAAGVAGALAVTVTDTLVVTTGVAEAAAAGVAGAAEIGAAAPPAAR